jgi:3-methyladenine DNA glycosylase AlkD
MTYTVADILDSGIVGVQLRDDSRREYTKWVRDKVVAEPREAYSISNRKYIKKCQGLHVPSMGFQ